MLLPELSAAVASRRRTRHPAVTARLCKQGARVALLDIDEAGMKASPAIAAPVHAPLRYEPS